MYLFICSFKPVAHCFFKGRWQVCVCFTCPHMTEIGKILSFAKVKDGIYAVNGNSQIVMSLKLGHQLRPYTFLSIVIQ